MIDSDKKSIRIILNNLEDKGYEENISNDHFKFDKINNELDLHKELEDNKTAKNPNDLLKLKNIYRNNIKNIELDKSVFDIDENNKNEKTSSRKNI